MEVNMKTMGDVYGLKVSKFGYERNFEKYVKNKREPWDNLFDGKELPLGWRFDKPNHRLEGEVTLHRAKNIDMAKHLVGNINTESMKKMTESVFTDDELNAYMYSIETKLNALVADTSTWTEGRTIDDLVADWMRFRRQFEHSETEASKAKRDEFERVTSALIYGLDSNGCISAGAAKAVNDINPECHAHSGTKLTKALGRIFNVYGYKNDKLLAEIGDAINDCAKECHAYISWDERDYLLMSHGKTWNSCHCPAGSHRPFEHDKAGRAGNYDGCYRQGVISYMIDRSSVVFYIEDSPCTSDHNLEYNWRMCRQMFHYDNGILIQGRFYPFDQSDGSSFNRQVGLGDYNATKKLVQTLIASALNIENNWKEVGRSYDHSSYFESYGHHYHDYASYENCNISTNSLYNGEIIEIGSEIIDTYWGVGEVDDSSWWENHRSTMHCSICGQKIYTPDGVRTDNGYDLICADCANPANRTCHDCGQISHKKLVGGKWCEDCAPNHGFARCAACDTMAPICDLVSVYMGNGVTKLYHKTHTPPYKTFAPDLRVARCIRSHCQICNNADRTLWDGVCHNPHCESYTQEGSDV